ncbi:hypothetical protein HPB47_007260 [Ixodes persulcatus]|uniref:Uncharacterized protein n=1 Tax=Ixodes persulcatus TaxID=34615 RepID=A0AC60P802_IXOPE|nr:hypothetical protein HPB47_007260 [Ixodes persulcatus]
MRKEHIRTAAVIHRLRTHFIIIPVRRHNMRWEADPACQALQRRVLEKQTMTEAATRLFVTTVLKAELLSLVNIAEVERPDLEKCRVGAEAQQHGHVVLRLVEYHSDGNSAEDDSDYENDENKGCEALES